MTIEVTQLHDKSGNAHAGYTINRWTLWPDADITAAPAETGINVSTDGAGKLTIPSNAVAGMLCLYVDDNAMQLLNVTELKT